MRVSIVNCVSTAEKMMRFSDSSLFRNAGHLDFDYVVVTWLASEEVKRYLDELARMVHEWHQPARLHIVPYQTNNAIGYVPNLRAMMNAGFEVGFDLNEFCGLTNTDVYHGENWLRGLVKYARPELCVNSLHITAVPRKYMEFAKRGIVNENLGVPEPETFNVTRFMELYTQHYQERLLTAEEINGPGGYLQVATMPYLFHRQWWDECGPWETTLNSDPTRAPDRRFFDRMRDAGCKFALSLESIIYHHEAVERKRTRPRGAEHLSEE